MDKSAVVVEREALAAMLSAVREMLRQVVVPAATGRVENQPGLEAAYVELSGAMERWEEARRDALVDFVKVVQSAPPLVSAEAQAPDWKIYSVIDAFTCRCSKPVPDELEVCRACGSFVPAVPAQRAA